LSQLKVQIVYLSPEDDIHSTCDMLGWVKASRALLVWPDQGRVLARRLDLVLLKRFSLHRNLEIGLLTFDKEIRDEASEIGIPVFDSLDDLSEDGWFFGHTLQGSTGRWEGSEPEHPSIEIAPERNSGWFLELTTSKKVFLVLGIVLSLVVIVGLSLPSAQIILSPSLEKASFDFRIDLAEADIGETTIGLIPIQIIKLKSKGDSTTESSGLAQVPASFATGKVTFTSMSQGTIQIPVNTTIRTAAETGIRFRTTRPAILEDEIGSEVEVPIEALTPGWIGNVPANAISLVEGPLGLLVTVSNQEATSGGQVEIRNKVLQVDLDELEEKLIHTLTQEAEEEGMASQPPDRILVEGSLELLDVIHRGSDHSPGEVADAVSLELSLEFSALSLAIKDLEVLAMIQLADHLSPDHLPVPGTYTFSAQLQPINEGLDQRWIQIVVEVDTYQGLDVVPMKRLIRGRNPSDATELLIQRYPLSKRPEFVIKPGWYPILPILDQRIHFSWGWETGL
jgi:hypothetical protein